MFVGREVEVCGIVWVEAKGDFCRGDGHVGVVGLGSGGLGGRFGWTALNCEVWDGVAEGAGGVGDGVDEGDDGGSRKERKWKNISFLTNFCT